MSIEGSESSHSLTSIDSVTAKIEHIKNEILPAKEVQKVINKTESVNNLEEYLEEYIKKYYYLCRGSISELLIINYIDFSKILGYEVIKFNCGLVVESKDIPNSRAICPDLLLIKKENKKIIPVEIKCFIGSNEFTLGLAREIKLARLQLKTISELLKEHYIGYSLMIIMFINDRDIKIQYIIL